MHEGERDLFVKWYENLKKENYTFDFTREFVHYCRTDVTVLRRAYLSFRGLLMQCGGVCPFSESCTIASACSCVYRKNFLEEDRIAVIPAGGYRWGDKQSRKAVAWLVWLEYKHSRIIIHAGRTREYRIPRGPTIDGYYEESGIRYVLQFHGCFWHGCQRCYRVNRDKSLQGNDSMDERYERTIEISSRIRSRGYSLTEI